MCSTEIYTLSLHDALPIWPGGVRAVPETVRLRHRRLAAREVGGDRRGEGRRRRERVLRRQDPHRDRKSTRLNSSHVAISYAVFCLKKKSYVCGNRMNHFAV